MPFADTVKKLPPFGKLKGSSGLAPATGHTPDKPTVMIMAYDWGTGAHAVVSDRLSLALQKRGCKVVMFTDEQTKARMQGFTDLGGTLSVVTHPDVTLGQVQYFEQAFKDHQPDVIITEYYPMGASSSPTETKMAGPCLKMARAMSQAEGRPLQIHALVRDIPDTGILPPDHLLNQFDRFLVRGDERIFSYATHFKHDKQWDQIKDKIHYVGYAASVLPALPKDGSVVVSLGGGFIHGDREAYINLIQAIKMLPKDSELSGKSWHIYAPPNLCAELTKEASWSRPSIKVEPFSAGFAQALQRADMVVCRGGMTAIESIAQGLPTLIIPRRYEYDGEQKTRSAELAKAAPHQVRCFADKYDTIASDLIEPLQETFRLKHIQSTPPFALNGHEKAADDIIALVQGKAVQSVGEARLR